MYAKSKLVYTVQEMNENKAIEDIEDAEIGGGGVRELHFSMCFPIIEW